MMTDIIMGKYRKTINGNTKRLDIENLNIGCGSYSSIDKQNISKVQHSILVDATCVMGADCQQPYTRVTAGRPDQKFRQ